MKTRTRIIPTAVCLLALSVIMTFMLGQTVLAQEEQSVTVGDFSIAPTDGVTVLAEGTDYSYSDGVLTVSTSVPVTISMAEGVTVTSDVIIISSAANAEIVFDGINISTDKENCIEVISSGETNFIFSGENNISSSSTSGTGIDVAPQTQDAVLILTSVNSGSITMTGGQYGIFIHSDYATQGIEILGNLNMDITGCSSHAIDNEKGYAKISGAPVVNIDVTKYGIYAVGIEISGGKLALKNDSGYIICSTDSTYITISNDTEIHIVEAERGIRVGNGKITVSDSAKIKVYGESEGKRTTGLLDNVFSSGELTIEDDVEVDVLVQEDAISGGVTKICDNAKIYIDIDCASTYSQSAIAFDSTLDIGNNAIIDIDIINGTKIYGFYDSSGTVNISGSAVVSIDNAYRSVYADYLNLSGSAQMTITGDINYPIYGDTTIKDNSKLKVTSTAKKIFYGSLSVTPAEGKTYIVTAGSSEAAAAEIGRYDVETSVSTKTTWRYFAAELEGTPETTVSVTESGVTIENLSESAILIVASYCEDRMVDAKIVTVTGDCEKTFSEAGLDTAGADSVKAFLWKDMTDMNPLCASNGISL